MIFKAQARKEVYDDDADKLSAELVAMCLNHGIENNKLIHESMNILHDYFVNALDSIFPFRFVVATAIAKAHYNLMIEIHGRKGNRDELPWTEINEVHRILVDYLADNEPKFAPDSEFEDRKAVTMKIRMMMNRFTSCGRSGAVGKMVWAMLTKDAKQAN